MEKVLTSIIVIGLTRDLSMTDPFNLLKKMFLLIYRGKHVSMQGNTKSEGLENNVSWLCLYVTLINTTA